VKKDAININDGTLGLPAGSLECTSVRYHELWLLHFLNNLFYVRLGYPVPVVFTSPMDAFANFQQLWASANNPFAYLLHLKDAEGNAIYQPYPQPVRYPIISVYRKGWKYRPYQNFSIHRMRHINWPTVSDTGPLLAGKVQVGTGLRKIDLGNVTTSRWPMAWDYRFQIDHFCMRPDTQSFFMEQLMREFWRTGGKPQTWLPIHYPGWGKRLVRLYLEGDIENLTPEEPEDEHNVEFRTSITIVIEGFDVDLYYKTYPAFWTLVVQAGRAVSPALLQQTFEFVGSYDERVLSANPTLDRRRNVPPDDGGMVELADRGAPTIIPVDMNPITANNQFGDVTLSS
jgi:hypothetical protein